MRFWTNFLAVSVALLCVQTAMGQYEQEDLRDFAERAVASKSVAIREPKVYTAVDEQTGAKILKYSLGNAILVSGDDYGNDAFQAALQQQLNVAVIRRYRNTRQQQQTWKPTLQKVEDEISKMLADSQDETLAEDERFRRIGVYEAEIWRLYEDTMNRAAKDVGATEASPIGEHVAGFYPVAFSARPNGRVYYLPAGLWDLYQLARMRGREVQKPEWTEVAQGDWVTLGGKYWLKATWDDSRSQTYGPIAVNRSSQMELSPSGIKVINDE